MTDPRNRPRRDLWREASGRRRADHAAGTDPAPRSQRGGPPEPQDAREELRDTLLPELSDLIARSNRRPGQPRHDVRNDSGAPDARQTRPLSDDERRDILRRYRESPPKPEPDDPGDGYGDYPDHRADSGRPGRDRPSGRTVTLGAILVIGILAVSLGAGGVFGERGAGAPEPASTVPPVVVALGSPTAAADLGLADDAASTPATADPAWPGQGDGKTVVCLDPGHGGWDPGYSRPFSGPLPGLAEADYNLAQAYDLADRLRERGYEVVMTRRSPSAVNADAEDVNGDGETLADSVSAGTLDELQARIDICNEADADLLVSMHINGFDANPNAQGYETWYTGARPFGDENRRFATLVFRALGDEMERAGHITTAREVNNDSSISIDESDRTLQDHMIITGPDVRGLIEASQMPGAIVEALFISNDADAYFLDSPDGHDAIVSAYESAIVAYFDEVPA